MRTGGNGGRWRGRDFEQKNEEMKRIATEAEENTMRHVLAFMPRLIYCDGFPRFILWRVGSEQPGIFPSKALEKSREYGVCRGKTSFRSFSES